MLSAGRRDRETSSTVYGPRQGFGAVLISGYSSVWKSARFGTERPLVRVQLPRPRGTCRLVTAPALQAGQAGFDSLVPYAQVVEWQTRQIKDLVPFEA